MFLNAVLCGDGYICIKSVKKSKYFVENLHGLFFWRCFV
jgi:hypothetical protein